MGTISITLPTIGQPNSTEDADIVSALTTLQNVINGSIDAANITDGAITAAELASSAVTSAKIATLPKARVYHNASQSISNATDTALSFNSERFDSDTIHDTATNTSRLTCKTAGVYTISAHVEFAANGAGSRRLVIRLNGTTWLGASLIPPGSGIPELSVTTLYQLAVNDYVEAVVYQDSGGALNVSVSSNNSPEFMMAWMGP